MNVMRDFTDKEIKKMQKIADEINKREDILIIAYSCSNAYLKTLNNSGTNHTAIFKSILSFVSVLISNNKIKLIDLEDEE